MSKSIVFISHITEEAELAQNLKKLIENSFLGMIEVFVSSDETSISAGAKWLDNITESLSNCAIELILCSPQSIKRPWINFEAGAGWVREIPVIPLCHSGIEPSQLPIPLNLLQAAKISEISSLKLIFPVLAQAIGSKTPNIDFSDFVASVKNFENKYTFWDECNDYFSKLNKFNPHIIDALRQGISIKLDLTEFDSRTFKSWMDEFFTKNEILSIRRIGNVNITMQGTFYDYELTPLPKLKNILNDINFKFYKK